MTASLRALRAVVLLVGFYLMGVVLLAVMAAVDWLLLTRLLVAGDAYAVAIILATTIAVAVPILLGMFEFLRAGRRGAGPQGVAATAQEQPELWAEVREAARMTGTQAPDELWLTGDVNAAVSEQARLLGLLPGRRRMYLGVPLLAGCSAAHLRAVLGHEFGHFSNQDTRLAGPTMRGRAAVLHTVEVFRGGGGRAHVLVGELYVRYARMFLKVSQAVGRRQELAADRVAAEHVGRDATAAALARVPVLAAAHDYYVENYALFGGPVNALPPVGEYHGGFLRLLAARGPEGLAKIASARRAPKPTPYDSHPPMTERVALIEALPDDGQADDPAAPLALSLLRDQEGVLAALESCTLPASAAGMRRMDWPALVLERSVLDAEGWAAPLRKAVQRAVRTMSEAGGPGTGLPSDPAGAAPELPGLADVLDAFDAGLLWMAVGDRMPKPAKASLLTGRSAREFIRPAVWDGVAGLVLLHLVAEGVAAPDPFWSKPAGLALPDVWEAGIDAAIDAAVDDTPDTTALRALLAGVGPVAA